MIDLDKSIGNQNRHSFWCDDLQQRRMYGGCLYLVDAYKAKRISADDPTSNCAIAMSKGQCNAFIMRDEEIAAGKSIYFVEAQAKPERVGSTADMSGDESYQRGWNQVGRSMGEKPVTVARRSIIPIKTHTGDDLNIGSFDIASVISNEIKKENNKSSVTDQIQKIKREIVTIIKTDPKQAKLLLARAKQLELSIA